ncbi:MAG: SMC-Scp complex subunit ScpB [Calditrichaeota bacterium]|nr:SMC-Scp complex subunit ScpB [Calditrichota bacterium]
MVYVSILEALLMTSDTPLTVNRIREIVVSLTPGEIGQAVKYLNEQYRQTGRSFEIREIAGGYQIFTQPEYSNYVEAMHQSRQKSRLTQKALETLAIIAYKQPITKQEIEEIRGVNADGVLKTLLSRNLTTISGRAKAPGSPFLYITTKKFLEYFGLSSMEDLPKLKEIEELIDGEDEQFLQGETLLREIDIKQLGMRANGGEKSDGNAEDGKEK